MYQILGLPRYPSMMKPWPQQWGWCCWQIAIRSGHGIPACLSCSGSSSIQRNFSVRRSFHLSLEWTWKAPTPEHPTWSFTYSLYFHFCPPSCQVLGQRHYQINYLHTNSSQKIPHGTLKNSSESKSNHEALNPNMTIAQLLAAPLCCLPWLPIPKSWHKDSYHELYTHH